jgi:hypothetical protein
MNEHPTKPHDAVDIAEKQELIRLCAVRVLYLHREGRKTDPEALQWAKRIVAQIKPLGRPLGTGERTA